MTEPTRRTALHWLMAAGAAPAFLREARAADTPRFALGVASGQPTSGGVVLWTRLSGELPEGPQPVRWEVAEDESFARVAAKGEAMAVAADAHTLHVDVTGLAADRWYWYRFAALGQQSTVGRTRTAPAPDAAVQRLQAVVASCQRWDHGHWAAWRDAAASAPDLVLFLGDYIYEYASPPFALRAHEGGAAISLAQYRARYAQYKSDPALQAAHAACPWIVIWDDHEVQNDYAGLQGEGLEPDFPARRAAAYRAWWEHMPLSNALRPVEAGGGTATIHGRLDWGRLARLQWIDTRQFRDPQACPRPGRGGSNTVRLRDCPQLIDPQRTMLGAAQERWLAEGWSLSQPWNLLAQQTLMARASRERVGPAAAGAPLPEGRYWTDGWDGYPAARARLLRVLAERKVPGAVVLSGDVHAHYVADLRADAGDERSPLVAAEFCSNSISSHGSAKSTIDSILAHNPHLHWGRNDQRGYVRLDVKAQSVEADLRVVADARDPASAVGSAVRFAVEAGQAGVKRV